LYVTVCIHAGHGCTALIVFTHFTGTENYSMIEQEEVMKSKKSLLKKYEIPVDHISFEYVEKCNDRKEMEKILKILRQDIS
jgi:hypothetical protein